VSSRNIYCLGRNLYQFYSGGKRQLASGRCLLQTTCQPMIFKGCLKKFQVRLALWGQILWCKIQKPWDSNSGLLRQMAYRKFSKCTTTLISCGSVTMFKEIHKYSVFVVQRQSPPGLSCWRRCVQFLCWGRWWALPRHECFSSSGSR